MPIEVSESRINKTSKCVCNFKCLTEKSHPRCSLEKPIGGTGVFLESASPDSCDYKVPFGYSCICTCPTRNDIANRYKR